MNPLFKDEDFKTPSMCVPTTQWNCVSVAITPSAIGVRDTKDSSKMTLVFTYEEWAVFLESVKMGEFDHLRNERS